MDHLHEKWVVDRDALFTNGKRMHSSIKDAGTSGYPYGNDQFGCKPHTIYKNKFQKNGRPKEEKQKFKQSWSTHRTYDFGVGNKLFNKAQKNTN